MMAAPHDSFGDHRTEGNAPRECYTPLGVKRDMGLPLFFFYSSGCSSHSARVLPVTIFPRGGSISRNIFTSIAGKRTESDDVVL